MFTELPFESRFKAAARAGGNGVECLFPYDYFPERIVELAENADVILALHNVSSGDWNEGERGLAAI